MSDRLIFTNGCFDVLHRGHIELLKHCASIGDKVVVGVNTDKSVKRLKGAARPINNEADRKALLEAIRYVDEVFLFEDDTPAALIDRIKPDVIVKGGDYLPSEVVGFKKCAVEIFRFMDGYSTTSTIAKLRDNSVK